MRPVLGVGWDVGGWIGRKQGVAVASLGTVSLEWLGTACAFGLADFPTQDWLFLDFIRKAWRDAPDDALETYRVILAIDAPLGFPKAFVKLLRSGRAPKFRVDGLEIDNPLAYRDTDRHVWRVFRKKPLSASFDKLGNNATVAIHHARRLAEKHRAALAPFDAAAADRHAIIEVYPALTKQRGSAECYDRIRRLLPEGFRAGTDECDACICAVLALAFGSSFTDYLPQLVAPPARDTASAEGWIYYAPLDWLRGGSRHPGQTTVACPP